MADAGGLVYLLEVDMGTRETPQDIEAREKKEARKRKGKIRITVLIVSKRLK